MLVQHRIWGVFKMVVVALLLNCCGGSGTGAGAAGGIGGTSAAGVSVDVSPRLTGIAPGATITFTAIVTGSATTTVTWSVQEASGGSIDGTGKYTAPSTEGTYHVVATSVADTTKSASATVQVSASIIIPPELVTDWNPGLNSVGGIPNRTTICATLTPSGKDDTDAINAAIAKCPDNQVVKLAPGTFIISQEGLVIQRSNVTLRGSGPSQTLINKTDELSGSPPYMPALVIGYYWTRHTVSRPLAADGLKGSHTITVSDASGLKVGEVLILNQVSDDTRSDTVPPIRKMRWGTAFTDPTDPTRRWYCEQNRPIGQTIEIQAINGNQLTLTTPLHVDFEVALQAHIARFSYEDYDGFRWSGHWDEVQDVIRYSGIEDLTVANGGGSSGSTGNLGIFAAAYCWIKNVESYGSIGSSCTIDNAMRNEVRDSYFHSTRNPNPGGDGYALTISEYASDNLYENNIVWNFNKMTVGRASGGGNVWGYNYFQDGYGDDYRDIVEVGMGANHYAGNHMELFEGNESFNYSTESKYGNSTFITVFRNSLTGLRISAPPLKLVDAWARRMALVDALEWWHSFVGNVLGYPKMPLLSGIDFEQSTYNQTGFIYQATDAWLNDPNIGDSLVPAWTIGIYDQAQPGAKNYYDPLAVARTFRHGNYDYVTNTTVWDSATANHYIPASMYLTKKPAFFGSNPWPWVTPEDPANPIAGILPAKVRFNSIHGISN